MIAYVFQKYPKNFAFQLFNFCGNLPVKNAILLKVAYFLTVSIVFSVYRQNFRPNNIKIYLQNLFVMEYHLRYCTLNLILKYFSLILRAFPPLLLVSCFS